MVMSKEIKSYKLLSSAFPPNPPIKDAKLYVLNEETQKVETYITDRLGNPKPLKDDIGAGIYTFFSSDNSIDTSGTNNIDITLESSLKARINSALQSGDNISELNNDANYITLGDIPAFNPSSYDLTDFNNLDADPFARISDLVGGGATQLSDLTDINTSTPTNRNVLIADGADWESRPLTEADISDLGNYLTTEINDLTSAVVWDNVPDVNITESSVTQHEGALSISTAQLVGTIGTGNLADDIVTIDKVDNNIEASLGLADSALQSGDNISSLNNDSGYISSIVEDTTPQLGGNLDLNGNSVNSISPIETTDTGTEIFLTTSGGILSNFSTANTNTTFTEGVGKVLNGWNQIRINTASEPTLPVSWIQQGGIEWKTGDLFLVVRNTGAFGVVYYYLPYDVQNENSEVATYEATNTGTVILDCNTFDSTYRVLTGNTDFQFSNTPASGESFVKTIECITTAGETLTFTTADKVIGDFVNDDSTINIITINFANYPTVGLRITVMINS